MLPFLATGHLAQRLQIVINGRSVFNRTVDEAAWQMLQIDVSDFVDGNASDDTILRIEFRTPDAASPAKFDAGPETVDLGFLLRTIGAR